MRFIDLQQQGAPGVSRPLDGVHDKRKRRPEKERRSVARISPLGLPRRVPARLLSKGGRRSCFRLDLNGFMP